jgi:hypothetical protein
MGRIENLILQINVLFIKAAEEEKKKKEEAEAEAKQKVCNSDFTIVHYLDIYL